MDRGEPHGEGELRGADGQPATERFVGRLVRGRREGFGTSEFDGGASYEGEFKGDKRHGMGILRGAAVPAAGAEGGGGGPRPVSRTDSGVGPGESYFGEWEDGSQKGVGVEVLADGSQMLGLWAGGARAGVGRTVRPDGSEYMGEMRGGTLNGQGKMRYANGDVYTGAWLHGMRHGLGLMRYHLDDVDGGHDDVHHGEWRADAPDGHGSRSYANGDEYTGFWKGGRREGRGECSYANGDVYDGAWEADRRHGEGVCRYASGAVYDGTWKEDERSGAGREKRADDDPTPPTLATTTTAAALGRVAPSDAQRLAAREFRRDGPRTFGSGLLPEDTPRSTRRW